MKNIKNIQIVTLSCYFMDPKDAERIRQKQEISFARRLWILQTAYENSLDGKTTETEELNEKYNISDEEIRTECIILKKTRLIDWQDNSDDGTPCGIEITGYAHNKIENAPIMHPELLEKDARELQQKGTDVMLKELEIERLKQETNLKKMEIWLNVTSTVDKASNWFSTIFGGR